MANIVFNIAKGRVAELFNRVDTNDPANSAIIVVPVDAGATTDATIKDYATLNAALTGGGGGLTERTTGGWNRKTLDDTVISSASVDNTGDQMTVTIPDQTWTSVTAGTVTDLLICYDSDTTAGTDANIVPLLCLDFAITPDGSDVLADAGTSIYSAA